MISHKKTPVAVLRTMLRLSVDEFAKLIEKAPSTVNSLESGRLALSGDTASKIALETGVALDWLLKGDPEQEPYVIESREVPKKEYTLAEFQKYRATGFEPVELPDELKLILAFDTICPWISVFLKAIKDGQGELAGWLMKEYIAKLAERFGKDDEAALQANEKTRITIGDDQYMLVDYGMRVGLLRAAVNNKEASREAMAFLRSRIRSAKKSPIVETPKNSASPPSPESVRRADARKSASPGRRRRGVPATG
jgi:transcriptional regulator with XRE-family HTH domain